ncbi:MAG: SCP2 sterol-binding domain-containing protein [Actinomycetota bacterium]|nr:SCP2 sterol-binding domain-containing protein [Actinomycetota bacterium]MDD5666563.1 SCP2 sterol-binding domain-containing protein [Actinomycetota bacterium]
MEVSENIGVKEYFEEVVPKMVEEQLAGSAITGMDGTVFTVEFDVKGDREYVYGITVKDAKDLAVSEGALESPMIKVEVSEDVWRKAVTGKLEGAMDMFMDMGQNANRKRYDTLDSIRGTMNVELAVPDGSQADLKVAFNDAASPEVTFKIGLEDWALMQKGELAGPTAFMTGKMKIEGDMPFAMALGNLMT